MNVTIIGTGYVGLTTGVCLAYLGHNVCCLDTDESKIRQLEQGHIPIYEPFLAEVMAEASRNLRFATSYETAIPESDVIFVAVGTPTGADGNPDLRYLRSAALSIGQHLKKPAVVVNKSTVPVGSGNWVRSLVEETANGMRFAVASNPEFLREGSALHDSLYPDRIVVGADESWALETMYRLYRPLIEQSFNAPSFLRRPEGLGAVPLVATDLASAELIKYAANAFLALKISYINEIGQLAERVGADIHQVAKGIGLDTRIGTRFLQAGLGWGGSCFGKDTAALITTAGEYNLPMPIVEAARQVNQRVRLRAVEKLQQELKVLKGCTIALLGLAFKPHTDDLRDAPALEIASKLMLRGAKVKAHDPVALARARQAVPEQGIVFCEDIATTLRDCDAAMLVTEWPQYQELDWKTLGATMRRKVVFDGRHFLDRQRLESAGMKLLRMHGDVE
ncbi:MAG: UDP-glucose/GDP-mannose dehydrogenase family protein [Acidobacteria bacterium]|nr:UDP-glucose/GDP-mannose dehydrogenase family protein [Acidobacteriota bacterium]